VKVQVVCISSADGAESRAVAQLVAERLGFRLADEAIVVDAAQAEGLLPEVVAHAETREARRTIEVDFGRVEKTEALREAIRAAVGRAADEGSVVIHAHAASYALAGREGVLRVLLTATAETRAARLADGGGLDRKAAARQLAESDKGRAAYLERFYDVKREQPTDYDLVLNTGRLTADEAAAVVVRAAQ
jgi:cytidylate kinase